MEWYSNSATGDVSGMSDSVDRCLVSNRNALMSLNLSVPAAQQSQLVQGFRAQYQQLHSTLVDVLQNNTDSFRLVRLGSDLQEFASIIDEVSSIIMIKIAISESN